MSTVIIYARIYGVCFSKALVGIARNAWTLLLPIALVFAWELLAGALIQGLGMAGGIISALLRSALVSCYIYFTGEVVAHSHVRLSDFMTSIKAYFWSVVNLFFVLWIAQLVLGLSMARNPNLDLIISAIYLLVFVLMPTLEVIYQRGSYGGMDTLQRSLKFLQENWIEWFLPQAPIVAALIYWRHELGLLLVTNLWMYLVVGAALHLLMVFRGQLFSVLDGSSHRQRLFKYRNASSAE
jgi:hypothetical protein